VIALLWACVGFILFLLFLLCRLADRHTRCLEVVQYAIERMAEECEDSPSSFIGLELRQAAERLEQLRTGKA